jgi:hypothetical protein
MDLATRWRVEPFTETLRGWPLLIESVLLNFFTFFDIIMVGILGVYAVAAVGITDQHQGLKVIGEESNGEEAWNVIKYLWLMIVCRNRTCWPAAVPVPYNEEAQETLMNKFLGLFRVRNGSSAAVWEKQAEIDHMQHKKLRSGGGKWVKDLNIVREGF